MVGAGVHLHAVRREPTVLDRASPSPKPASGFRSIRNPSTLIGLRPAGRIRNAYFRLVDRLVKVADRLVPTAVTPPMITTAIRAAIRPYSMAVAPDSSLQKLRNIVRIVGLPLKIPATLTPRIC